MRENASQLCTGTTPRQILFLHIPKTAGSTARTYIEACIGSHRSGRSARLSELDLKHLPTEVCAQKARSARFASGHFSWNLMQKISRQEDACRFTVLRDPYERLRSYYFYMRHHPINKIPRGLLSVYARAELPPAEFFNGGGELRFNQILNNYMTRALSGSLDIPQSPADWNRALTRAKANLERLDHVCFTDTFRSDFIQVLRTADLPHVEPIRRQNVTAELVEDEAERRLLDTPFDRDADHAIELLIAYDIQLYAHARQLRFPADQRREVA
ncbi:MAG: sulfotransferase family 2 domain-containing protein [Pseudomonadota bacterium]